MQNAEFDAQTVGAGEQAGADTFSYNISTKFMDLLATISRETSPPTRTRPTIETAGRTVTYRTTLPTPCGESDRNEMSAYALEAYVTAHFVYTKGTNGSPNQVSQNTATATIAGKTDRAYAAILKDNGQHWETEEWRVQDSSSETSDAKGSGTPIELKVVISNDNSVTDYDADLHMPASKVFIDSETLSVTAGPGNVTLKECTTDSEKPTVFWSTPTMMSCPLTPESTAATGPARVPGHFPQNRGARADGAHADGFDIDRSLGVRGSAAHLHWRLHHTLFCVGQRARLRWCSDIHVVEKTTTAKTTVKKRLETTTTIKSVTMCSVSRQLRQRWLETPRANEGQTHCRNLHSSQRRTFTMLPCRVATELRRPT